MSTEQGAKGDQGIIPTKEYMDDGFTKFQKRQILVNKTVFSIRVLAVILALVGMGVDEVPVMLFAILLMQVAAALRDD
jgi:hypothetical protein